MREYSPEELAIFARYVENRAAHQPSACDRGNGCWVLVGPPGYSLSSNGEKDGCLRCGGLPSGYPMGGSSRGVVR